MAGGCGEEHKYLKVLGIIPARGGSKGLPGKCVRKLLGKEVIRYTIEAALKAERVDMAAVTTDDPQVKDICGYYGKDVAVIDRPVELASDNARIDDVMRHCCGRLGKEFDYQADIVVLLYANVPVRAEEIIDRAIEKLIDTGADSVQTMTPIGKFHPYWLYKLEDDRARKYIDNTVYQRQKLPELYCVDGAVGVVRYDVLTQAEGSSDPHAFWGEDRRGLVQQGHETVDIDTLRDFYAAEAAIREKESNG